MKTTRRTVFALSAVAVSLVVAILFASKHHAPPQERKVALEQSATRPAEVAMHEDDPMPAPRQQTELPIIVAPGDSVESLVPGKAKSQAAAPKKPKADKERRDPLARVALSFVGVDSDAEKYWLEAIFDSSLSDQEREDLMEDLNEEGLSNPHRPGSEDLPLILNRLAIIEELAPAADDFMQIHLWEAYKDLTGLLNGQPPP